MSNIASDRTSLRERRILVVEDELLVAMEMEDLLVQQGCTVIGPAKDIDGALALIANEPLDAVVLDLNLSGEAAVPVASALSSRGVPFVVVTGYSKKQSRSPELQDAPVLEKPIDPHLLLRTLEQVIGEPFGAATQPR